MSLTSTINNKINKKLIKRSFYSFTFRNVCKKENHTSKLPYNNEHLGLSIICVSKHIFMVTLNLNQSVNNIFFN